MLNYKPALTSNHFEFLQYKYMPYIVPIFLALLLIACNSQSNVCYANCKKGYCSPTNAISCTECDQGMLNINSSCVSSNIQPNPLTILKPNSNNTQLNDYIIKYFSCDIQTSNGKTKMLFQPQIGNSYTQQFDIPAEYSYMRIKFNAIILTSSPVTQSVSVLVNVVPVDNRRSFILSKTESINPTNLTLTCNSSITNINNYYGVFFMDYKVSNSNKSILLEVIPQGLVNAYIAVSNVEVYYGNCDQTCGTCEGPTPTDCTSCKGLLLALTNSSCVDCPTGFYQNITCYPCPQLCGTCSFQNKRLTCLSCRATSPLQVKLINGTCNITQFYKSSLSNFEKDFDASSWKSSEVSFNPVSLCGTYKLLGGISIGVAKSLYTYTIADLPVHSIVYLYYTLFLIDQTQLDIYQYQLQVDKNTKQINFTVPSVLLTNQCGGQRIDYVKLQNYSFVHNSSNAKVTINVYKNFMGIRDFLFVVDNPTTDPNCISFSNGQCNQCRYGLIVANSTCSVCLDGFYLDPKNSTLYCNSCPFSCKTCSATNTSIRCISCRDPLKLDGDFCIDSSNNLFEAEILSTIPLSSQAISFKYYPNLQKKGIDMCGSEEIIGTSSIKSKFLKMSRQYTNLYTHTGVILYFTLYQIDDNYFPNNSLSFTLNSKVFTQQNLTILSQYSTIKTQLCGNSSWDNKFIVQLTDDAHNADTLDFSINVNRIVKIGINNVQLYLLNIPANTATDYKVEIVPGYSINTPPQKGIEVKLTFENTFFKVPDVNNSFIFTFINTTSTSTARMLQQSHINPIVTINATLKQKEIIYFLDLNQDYNDAFVLQVRPSSQNSVYFNSGTGIYNLISQAAVNVSMTKYVNVGIDAASHRSNLRNLYNIFRGAAILGLFIGMASFVFGMSAAFDDFFILCQLIFVHVFIQLNYNPPSIIIPFTGLHIVQFMSWLPSQAREAIQKGIIPKNLYQYTPLVFQQFYQDTVFARTIYHTILFIGLILGLWLTMHVCLLIYDSKFPNQKTKYQNFFVYFYKQYDSKKMVLVDKIVRFAYFTIVWACILQLISFQNSPSTFHIWNSALTIIMFAFVIVYPVVMFYLLYRNANSLTDTTFGLAYEQIRINKQYLFYYLIRYYKLFIIAIVVAASYNAKPVIPLIILIILNAIDVAFIIRLKPLGMMQAELIQATVFYPLYPTIYHFTTIIQQFVFIVLQIVFLIMIGIRSSTQSGAYMGFGYAVCVFTIILILNGLVRLIWGVLKIIQYCYLEREANYLSIQKDILEDPAQNMQINADGGRLQEQMSRKILTSTLNNKRRPTNISQFR